MMRFPDRLRPFGPNETPKEPLDLGREPRATTNVGPAVAEERPPERGQTVRTEPIPAEVVTPRVEDPAVGFDPQESAGVCEVDPHDRTCRELHGELPLRLGKPRGPKDTHDGVLQRALGGRLAVDSTGKELSQKSRSRAPRSAPSFEEASDRAQRDELTDESIVERPLSHLRSDGGEVEQRASGTGDGQRAEPGHVGSVEAS